MPVDCWALAPRARRRHARELGPPQHGLGRLAVAQVPGRPARRAPPRQGAWSQRPASLPRGGEPPSPRSSGASPPLQLPQPAATLLTLEVTTSPRGFHAHAPPLRGARRRCRASRRATRRCCRARRPATRLQLTKV
eukprot:scaffold224286_cov24-Tisochrysis_lutea.AAC.1